MRKQRLCRLLVLTGLVLWARFCYMDVPKLQAQQRGEYIQIEEGIETPFSNMYEDTEEPEFSDLPSYVDKMEIIVTQSGFKEEVTLDKEVIEKEPENSCNYTEEELYLLAQLIYSEAGIESYQCQVYCGSVVLNRMKHEAFPNTLYEVIFQRTGKNQVAQFSVTLVGKNGIRPIDCVPSESALKAAAEVLTHGSQLPEDVIYFFSDRIKGHWLNSRVVYTQIDSTIFAYEYAKEE